MYIDAIFFVTTHILVFLSLIRLYIPVKSMNYVALLSFSHSVDCFHDCLVGRRWIPNPGASFQNHRVVSMLTQPFILPMSIK